MKNKLILSVIMVGALLQPNITYSAQDWMINASSTAQGFMDKLLAWWNTAAPSINVELTDDQAFMLGGATAVTAATVAMIKIIQNVNARAAIQRAAQKKSDEAAMRSAIAAEKKVAIAKIKMHLQLIMKDRLLYPTRSSKLHALLKKDGLLASANRYINHYVNDEYGLFDEACAQLSAQISKLNYSDEQRDEDRLIDAYIAELKISLADYTTLEKIEYLQSPSEDKISFLKYGSIEGMRAYLSAYYILMNELEIENKLSLIDGFNDLKEQIKENRKQQESVLKSKQQKRRDMVKKNQPAEETITTTEMQKKERNFLAKNREEELKRLELEKFLEEQKRLQSERLSRSIVEDASEL